MFVATACRKAGSQSLAANQLASLELIKKSALIPNINNEDFLPTETVCTQVRGTRKSPLEAKPVKQERDFRAKVITG